MNDSCELCNRSLPGHDSCALRHEGSKENIRRLIKPCPCSKCILKSICKSRCENFLQTYIKMPDILYVKKDTKNYYKRVLAKLERDKQYEL